MSGKKKKKIVFAHALVYIFMHYYVYICIYTSCNNIRRTADNIHYATDYGGRAKLRMISSGAVVRSFWRGGGAASAAGGWVRGPTMKQGCRSVQARTADPFEREPPPPSPRVHAESLETEPVERRDVITTAIDTTVITRCFIVIPRYRSCFYLLRLRPSVLRAAVFAPFVRLFPFRFFFFPPHGFTYFNSFRQKYHIQSALVYYNCYSVVVLFHK